MFKRFSRTLGAAPTTSAHLGFSGLSSSVATSTSGSGPYTIYSPTSGTASYQLPGGNYLAIIQANYTYTAVPNTTQINMQYGIQYSATQAYTSPTSAVAIDTTISYTPLNQNQIVNINPLMFTVPSGNTNYYYSFAYFGLGSLVNGGTVTATVKIISLTRIG